MNSDREDQPTRQEKARSHDHRQRRRHHPCQVGWHRVTAPSRPQPLLSQRDQALAQAIAEQLRPLLEEMTRRLDAILTQLPQPERQPALPRKRPTAHQSRRRTRP
jgi:hypothetical protein